VESIGEDLRRLILDVSNDADRSAGPIRERHPFLRPDFSGLRRNQVAMRVFSGMPEMISKKLKVILVQAMLGSLGRPMQLIEGHLGLVGKITFPQSMPAKDAQSQAFSRLRQLKQTSMRPQISGVFQLLDQTQDRSWRPSKPAGQFFGGQRSAVLLGAIDLLERIFAQDAAAPTPCAATEQDEAAEQDESEDKSENESHFSAPEPDP
jgi:hypothetical protein